MLLTRLFLGTSLSVCLLTACDSMPSNTVLKESVEDPVEATGNPCLEPWIIQGMKDNIIEHANDVIRMKYNYGKVNTSRLNNADINFSYITQPTKLENGTVSCSAQVNITYIGDAKSSSDLVMSFVKSFNNNYPNSYAYSVRGLGINEFNVREFREIKGNSFSIPVEYEIKTTYSESGTEQESYEATIGMPATMLATIAVLDHYMQKDHMPKGYASETQVSSQEEELQASDTHNDYVPRYNDQEDDKVAIQQPKADSYYEEYDAVDTVDTETSNYEDVVIVEEPAQ